MATYSPVTLFTYVAKGYQNSDTPANKFTFFQTNFNMPVVNFSGGTWTRYVGDNSGYPSTSTTYDMTGFVPGYEICCAKGTYDYNNVSGSTISGASTNWSISWLDTDGTTVLRSASGTVNLPTSPNNTYDYFYVTYNIGVSPQEIHTSGTYYVKITDSYSSQTQTTNVIMNNVPATNVALGSDKEGYIWVEGNNLCLVNANQWKHTMVGTATGTTGKIAGTIWIDNSNVLHWIGSGGAEYTAAWQKQQFASWFSNGATGGVFGQTPGGIWMDSEYGLTHLGYIGYDQSKYVTGAGANPYA